MLMVIILVVAVNLPIVQNLLFTLKTKHFLCHDISALTSLKVIT